MTDKQTLLSYRMQQAKETLTDAQKMLRAGVSPRSVVNRAYYAMFYAAMALFIRFDVALKTSKHSGLITIFDQEFVHAGKIDKRYSKMLHRMFDARQEIDYKEMVLVSAEEATDATHHADAFIQEIERMIAIS